ncbi:MAG: carboxypeptidase-like regulatory domain-containing protein, partial [Promethearchaeota archaeon]
AQDNIYVWETTNFVVIEYHDYYHLSGDLTGTFEVILFATGEIIFQYQYIGYDNNATVGLNHGYDETLYNEYMPYMSGVMEFALHFEYMEPPKGNLQVFVYDPSGTNPMEGVEVQLEGISVVFSFTIFTDNNGGAYFEGLIFGEYRATFSEYGYVDYSTVIWIENDYPNQVITISLEVDESDPLNDEPDPNDEIFDTLGIPGYSIGIFIITIGISFAFLVKSKKK